MAKTRSELLRRLQDVPQERWCSTIDELERAAHSSESGDSDDPERSLIEGVDRSLVGVELWQRRPSLSEIPRTHVVTFASLMDRVGIQQDADTSDAHDPDARAMKLYLDLVDGQHLELLGREVRPRLAVALDFYSRRRFAKLRLLAVGWPRLVERIRSARGLYQLKDLERAALDPKSVDLDVLDDSWLAELQDERLRAFLGRPPSIQKISSTELEDVLQIETEVGHGLPSAVEVPLEAAQPIGYMNYNVVLSAVSDQDGGSILTKVQLNAGDVGLPDVQLPIERFDALVEELTNSYLSGGLQRRELTVVASQRRPEEILRELGTLLWELIFEATGADVSQLLPDLTIPENRVRLTLVAEDARLAGLPWESLFIPQLRVHGGLTVKLSIVRGVPDAVQLARRRPAKPLKILVVAADLPDMPLPGLVEEIALISRSLEGHVGSGAVELIIHEDASIDSLQEQLRRFEPHVFHFIGHGVIVDGAGSIVLQGVGGSHSTLAAGQLSTMLHDSGILVGFLNGCDTGTTTESGLAHNVARTLVAQGVPVSIATSREVIDTQAMLFAAEFYQALGDGYHPETAVAEARKALSVKNWDWSAYVVHVSPDLVPAEMQLI